MVIKTAEYAPSATGKAQRSFRSKMTVNSADSQASKEDNNGELRSSGS